MIKKILTYSIFSVFSFIMLSGCITGCNGHKNTIIHESEKIEKYEQTNVIRDTYQQKLLLQNILKANYNNSYYVYDTERWGVSDHWDDTFDQLEVAFDGFLRSEKIEKVAQQDCEDTALTILIFAITHGFPYDQLELYYCLVPKDTAGNTNDGGYVGHAVVVAYIDGEKPWVLEQLPYPRTLEYVINTLGYQFIAVHSMDQPIDVFYEADPEIIDYFKNGGNFTLDMIQPE